MHAASYCLALLYDRMLSQRGPRARRDCGLTRDQLMTTDTDTSRVAVVTGGASGIGQSICEHLARGGHRVAVLDLDGDHAEATATALRSQGHRAVGAQLDVADRGSVDQAYALVRSNFGPIEIVVTSAAIALHTSFEDITLEDWDRTLAVNLTGTFHCVQAAIGEM